MMKRLFLFGFLQMVFCNFNSAQVLCVQCFEQNDSISSFVNNRITNGSFEHTTCTPDWLEGSFCPNSSRYNCDIENWICTDGGTSTYTSIFDAGLSTIPEGNNAAYFGNGNSYPCSTTFDDTTCMTAHDCVVNNIPTDYPSSLPGYGEMTGVSLEQTVNGLTIGETYVLEFWAGGESLGGVLTDKGLFAVNLGFGRIMLRCRPTHEVFSPVGTRYIIQFNATASTHIIRFTNWGHACTGCTELVLDDVRLYTLEELEGSITRCITQTADTREESPMEIYPNPFSSELNVVTTLSGTIEWTLYDNKSSIVMFREFQDRIIINTSDLAAGVYFYQAFDEYGQYMSGKILKEK